jgi:hypothetical protein
MMSASFSPAAALQVGDHVTFEPVSDHKQLLSGAVRTAGEQL